MLTEDDRNLHRLRSDATVSATNSWTSPGGAVAVAEPIATELEHSAYEPRTQRLLKIIHQPTERVVPVLELLSPASKAPGEDGLEAYLPKRTEILGCRCNLVELDLLRGGERLRMAGPLPPGD
jgi:hypothetical protein